METKKFNVGDVVTFGDNNVGKITKVNRNVYTVGYFNLSGEVRLNKTHVDNSDGYLKEGTDQDKKKFADGVSILYKKDDKPSEVSDQYLTKVRVGDVVSFGDDLVGIIAKANDYYWVARYISGGKIKSSTSEAGERYFKEANKSQRDSFFNEASNFTFRDFFEFGKK